MRILMMAAAWVALGFGIVGIFVPVLPTTPLVLLAAFLFGKSSPRMMAWLADTKVYKVYVVPFKESGGITRRKKAHILGVSYLVLAISAAMVQRPFVWAILTAVALFLAWLMLVHIPTAEESAVGKFVDIEVGEEVVDEMRDSIEELTAAEVGRDEVRGF